MKLIILKLGETLARALFVFICVYSLALEQSGQFGILVTMMGLFAFAFGYERHVDIQRRYADSPSEFFDSIVAKSLCLYGFNYAVLLPLFLLCAVLWSQLPLIVALACMVIVVSEHISNKTYHLSLVNTRYHKFLVLTLIKNTINIGFVAYWVFSYEQQLQLTDVIKLWTITSLICLLLIIALWLRINDAQKDPKNPSLWQNIKAQFRLSYSHFIIGFFAIMSLQLDRIMAGSLLSFEDSGLYFRHVMLVAFIYQFFNIAFFNRLLPHVYANAKKESAQSLRGRTRREYFKVMAFTIVIYAGFLISYHSPLEIFFIKYQLQIEILGVLLVTFLIRAAADFNGVVYNAKFKEKSLLRYQMAALGVGVVSFVSLTLLFGMLGTICAGSIGASTYWLLTVRNYQFIDSGPSAIK